MTPQSSAAIPRTVGAYRVVAADDHRQRARGEDLADAAGDLVEPLLVRYSTTSGSRTRGVRGATSNSTGDEDDVGGVEEDPRPGGARLDGGYAPGLRLAT